MSSLVDDQFWQLLEPLLPRPPRRHRHPRPSAPRRPQGPRRNPVRAHHRDRLAAAPARTRLRLRHDLLAPPPRVAAGRRLPAPPPTPPRQVAPDRPARLHPRRLRLLFAARAFGGDKTGP